MIRRLGEYQVPERANVIRLLWSEVSETQTVSIEANPAARTALIRLLFLEQETPVLASPQLSQAGVLFAEAIKKVQNRIAFQTHLELQEEPAVNEKLVADRAEIPDHGNSTIFEKTQ